ncbi:MAG: hypothetical protein R2724_30135 [Bryobacterales bacterium]
MHPLHLAIDGETHEPLFAALAPGLAGLLQVNVPTQGARAGSTLGRAVDPWCSK